MRPSRLSVLGGIAIVLSIGAPSHALTFNFDYSDGTVAAQFGGNFANFQAAANRAAVNFTSVFNDNININIKMSADNSGSVLGQSSQFLFSSAYSDIRAAMVADATTADDTTVLGPGGSFTVADPNAGGSWQLTRAQLKALGMQADDLLEDANVTIGSQNTYDYDPSNGVANPADFDLVGILSHEFSEVMGRIGQSNGLGGANTQFDNFSYTAPGVKSLGSTAGNYFSLDNGVTSLRIFNAIVGGDTRDWADGQGLDSFNAFGGPGVVDPVSAVDLQTVDVAGFNRAPAAAPEPGTLVLLALGGMCIVARRRFSVAC